MDNKINQIRNILKNINYPGFNRDIVSFGMVKEILDENNTISIILQINSDNNEKLSTLTNEIKQRLKENGFDNNKIKVVQQSSQASSITNHQNLSNQQEIPGIEKIIAIASGKGGVGKSTIAVNIAASLSREYKVGILDLDIYGPSLPMLVDINNQPKITTENKLVPIEKFNMSLMSFGFMNPQNSPTIWRGPMVSRMTQQFFENVEWGNLDFLILDLPPGTGDIQLTLVQKLSLTGAVIVTTPQKLALLDVQKGADMFSKVNTPVLGVVENMTHFMCPHCDEITKIFPGKGGSVESSRLNVPLLGKIHLNPEITESTENGTPFVIKYSESPIASEFHHITSQICEIT